MEVARQRRRLRPVPGSPRRAVTVDRVHRRQWLRLWHLSLELRFARLRRAGRRSRVRARRGDGARARHARAADEQRRHSAVPIRDYAERADEQAVAESSAAINDARIAVDIGAWFARVKEIAAAAVAARSRDRSPTGGRRRRRRSPRSTIDSPASSRSSPMTMARPSRSGIATCSTAGTFIRSTTASCFPAWLRRCVRSDHGARRPRETAVADPRARQ